MLKTMICLAMRHHQSYLSRFPICQRTGAHSRLSVNICQIKFHKMAVEFKWWQDPYKYESYKTNSVMA